MKRPVSLLKSFSTVGSWTILSRVFGFIRDIFIATFLGSGPIAQAFLIALALPNMFRAFFAEGALNLSFIPIFSKKLSNRELAIMFAKNTLYYLLLILISLNVLAQLLMPWVIYAMASGFYLDQRFELAVIYTRITFPYLLFISITALLSGIMNSIGKFAVAAAAPIILNLIFIICLTLASYRGWDIGLSLAWAVPIAGFFQMSFLWMAARRSGFTIFPKFSKLNPDLKRLFKIAIPAILSGGLIQINLLVGRQVASYFDGGIAWLSYADRLYQLPLGVVGISIGIVLLPNLAKQLSKKDSIGSRHTFNRSVEFALTLTLPAAIGLIIIAEPIISALYERGAFSSRDTINTAAALIIYGFGLPAFVGQKILQPVFYARENTRTPFNLALIAMFINLSLAIGLTPFFGYLAPAIGTTAASWGMVLMLRSSSKKYGLAVKIDKRNRRIIPRLILNSIIMGLLLFLINTLLDTLFSGMINKYMELLILLMAGVVSYLIFGRLLGAFSVKELKGYFKN